MGKICGEEEFDDEKYLGLFEGIPWFSDETFVRFLGIRHFEKAIFPIIMRILRGYEAEQ